MSWSDETRQSYKRKMLEKYGADFYKKIGAMGGRACVKTKGFGKSFEYASNCGKKGGRRSAQVRWGKKYD